MILGLNKFRNSTKLKKGFSLVELLVVVSIFLIITSVTLFKQGKFSSDTLITNTAYEVALAIREAQVYGVGSKQGGGEVGNKSYGVHFDEHTDNSFVLFSEDPDPNNGGSFESSYYYSPNQDSDYRYDLVKQINFEKDQKIKYFCVKQRGQVDFICSTNQNLDTLDISFIKPNLDAVIVGINDGAHLPDIEEAKIIVESSLGDKCRTVLVNWVGQINVDSVVPGDNGCSE